MTNEHDPRPMAEGTGGPPVLPLDLTLKTKIKLGFLSNLTSQLVTVQGFTPSGLPSFGLMTRFREGLRFEERKESKRRTLDIHYSQVAEIKFHGRNTISVQRSVVGRAVLGKVVAGDTGALVGAMSGLQTNELTQNHFGLVFWDPARGVWAQLQFDGMNPDFPEFMDGVVQDMEAFLAAPEPNELGRADQPTSERRAEPSTRTPALSGCETSKGAASSPGTPIHSQKDPVSAVLSRKNVLTGTVVIALSVSAWLLLSGKAEDPEVPGAVSDAASAQVPIPIAPPIPATQEMPRTDPEPGPAATVEAPVGAEPPGNDDKRGDTVPSPNTAAPVESPPARVADTSIPDQDSIPGSRGPSFDCAKASQLVERLVCANPNLAELDQVLAEKYTQALQSQDARRIKEDQVSWLRQRARCTTKDCVADMYKIRIAQLSIRR